MHVWDMAGQRRFRVCHPNYQGIGGKNLWICGCLALYHRAAQWLRCCHHIRHHGQGILQQRCSLGRGEALFVLEASSSAVLHEKGSETYFLPFMSPCSSFLHPLACHKISDGVLNLRLAQCDGWIGGDAGSARQSE